MFLDCRYHSRDRWGHCLSTREKLASAGMFRRFAPLVLVAGSAFVLSGCFSSGPAPTTTTTFPKSGLATEPASSILYKACGATRELTSATMSTTFFHPALSSNYSSGTWTVGPGGSSGTITTKGFGTVSVISTPLSIYLKANAKFWTNLSASFATHATTLASQWVAVSVDSPSFPLVSPLADLGSMTRVLAGCFNSPNTAGIGSANGIPLVYLHVHGGSGTQALGVALRGDPLIITMTQFSGSYTLSTTTLSNFNAATSISAPSSAAPIASLLK